MKFFSLFSIMYFSACFAWRTIFLTFVFTRYACEGMILHKKLFAVCKCLQSFLDSCYNKNAHCFLWGVPSTWGLFLPPRDLCFGGVSKSLPVCPSLQKMGNGIVAEEPPATGDVCSLSREFLVYWMFIPVKSSNSPVSWQKFLCLTDEHR